MGSVGLGIRRFMSTESCLMGFLGKLGTWSTLWCSRVVVKVGAAIRGLRVLMVLGLRDLQLYMSAWAT